MSAPVSAIATTMPMLRRLIFGIDHLFKRLIFDISEKDYFLSQPIQHPPRLRSCQPPASRTWGPTADDIVLALELFYCRFGKRAVESGIVSLCQEAEGNQVTLEFLHSRIALAERYAVAIVDRWRGALRSRRDRCRYWNGGYASPWKDLLYFCTSPRTNLSKPWFTNLCDAVLDLEILDSFLSDWSKETSWTHPEHPLEGLHFTRSASEEH